MEQTHNFPLIKEPSLKVLLEVVKEMQPNNILEIGTCIGFSGTMMLKECSAHLTTIEIDKSRADMAEQNFEKAGVFSRVTQIVGDASAEILNLKTKYDLIFLDGPKGQYIKQLPTLLDLLEDGGVLFADNVLFRGYVLGDVEVPRRFRTIAKRLNEFIESCKTNKEFERVEIKSIGDGVLIATKKRG